MRHFCGAKKLSPDYIFIHCLRVYLLLVSPVMPDNINKVMITNATRNNTTVSNITFFVGDNVISQGISFSCSSGWVRACVLYI